MMHACMLQPAVYSGWSSACSAIYVEVVVQIWMPTKATPSQWHEILLNVGYAQLAEAPVVAFVCTHLAGNSPFVVCLLLSTG